MAGFWHLSHHQLHDSNGLPVAGARARFFSAETSAVITVYQDYGLTNPHGDPVVSNSMGVFPPVFFDEDDAFYRQRITDATGTVITGTDVGTIPIIGPTGGGTVTTVDENAIFTTGMPLWMPGTGTKTGWVRLNARTIGDATSGASERANADVQTMYEYLYATFSDAICPVLTGRGANVAADWVAHKQLTLLDMRGRGAFGLADMGNSAINRIKTSYFDVGSNIIGGSSAGQDDLAILQGNIPAYTLSHTLGISGSITAPETIVTTTNKDNNIQNTGGALNDVPKGVTLRAGSAFALNGTVTGSVTSNGSGNAFETVPPLMVGTWYMRL